MLVRSDVCTLVHTPENTGVCRVRVCVSEVEETTPHVRVLISTHFQFKLEVFFL